MLSLSSPSSLQGDTTKVWQCSLAVGGKPQKRAGGRGDQSSDTAATSTKPDRCFEEVLPQVFYQKKKWLQTEATGLRITESDTSSEQKYQHLYRLSSNAEPVHMLKWQRRETTTKKKTPIKTRSLKQSCTRVIKLDATLGGGVDWGVCPCGWMSFVPPRRPIPRNSWRAEHERTLSPILSELCCLLKGMGFLSMNNQERSLRFLTPRGSADDSPSAARVSHLYGHAGMDTTWTTDVSPHVVTHTASKCEEPFHPWGLWHCPFLTFKDILGKRKEKEKKKREREKRTEPKHVFLHYHKECLWMHGISIPKAIKLLSDEKQMENKTKEFTTHVRLNWIPLISHNE